MCLMTSWLSCVCADMCVWHKVLKHVFIKETHFLSFSCEDLMLEIHIFPRLLKQNQTFFPSTASLPLVLHPCQSDLALSFTGKDKSISSSSSVQTLQNSSLCGFTSRDPQLVSCRGCERVEALAPRGVSRSSSFKHFFRRVIAESN